jgi:REP element-mobilizing transposase RayT
MARPLRIEYEGAFYHITARGNERREIYQSQSDYNKFKARGNERREIYQSQSDYNKFKAFLKEAQDKYSFILHCFVLMSNHYHLLIETPGANLSKIMHFINSSYTTYFNISQKRSGHLFQGRYKACLVEHDNYLLELSRYLHLNPVRAKIVERPEEYPYSSYRSYVQEDGEDIVCRDFIWKMIAENKPEDAACRYKDFVDIAIGRELTNPLKQAHGGMILGEKAFIKNTMQRLKSMDLHKGDISYSREPNKVCDSDNIIDKICSFFEKSRDDLFNEKGEWRNISLYLIKKYTSLSNKQIGKIFGNISYSAVAKVYQRYSLKIASDPELAKKVESTTDYLFSLSNVKN